MNKDDKDWNNLNKTDIIFKQRNNHDNENINKKGGIKYGDADEKETSQFLKILKKWLAKYNSFDSNNSGSDLDSNLLDGLSSKFNIGDETGYNILINTKTNFARVKIYIDYLELLLECPQIARSIIYDFIKFSKFVQTLTTKILTCSNKVKADISIFTDLVILNFPHLESTINNHNLSKIVNANSKKGEVLGFSKAYVLKVKSPSYLLWSKKIIYQCECQDTKEPITKYFNIYKSKNFNPNFNENLIETFCPVCKKEFLQNKNFDIYLECQEITLALDKEENCLINNVITLFTFGELINSVKEGMEVSLVAFYMPGVSNTFEKNFEFGHFIALNLNMSFKGDFVIKEKNFKYENNYDVLKTILNRNSSLGTNTNLNFNKNILEIELLRAVTFQKQITADLFKLLFQNFCENSKANLKNGFSMENQLSSNTLLSLVIDLSITQRDYFNYSTKNAFLYQGENYSNEMKKATSGSNNLLNSRSVLFKTGIFQNNKKSTNQNEDDFKKYFRLTRQFDYQKNYPNSHELLVKPLHLFFIVDNFEHNFLNNIYIYADMKNYKNLISIYPFFNQSKFVKENIINFLISCNNGIVILPDVDLLSKNEIEIISNIMNENLTELNVGSLNITFWVIGLYDKLIAKKGKLGSCSLANSLFQEIKIKAYDQIIQKCEIVLNLSRKYNLSRGIDLNTAEKKYSNQTTYSAKLEEVQILKNVSELKNLGNVTESLNKCTESHYFKDTHDNFNDPYTASKFLEDYFVIKRNLNNINFDDLVSL